MATERCIAAIVLLPALLLGAVAAGAHAFLDRASPPAGSALRTAPGEISLWFAGKLEPTFSTLVVRNSDGGRVDTGNAYVDQANRSLLRVSLRPLPPGFYRVVWRVVSVDTHATQGDYTFRVGE